MTPRIASLKEARDYIIDLPDVIHEHLDDPARASLHELMKGFEQFFDIVATINLQASEGEVISSGEATDIGNHGFDLIRPLMGLMNHLDLPHRRRDLEQISLIVARWIIRYGGQVKQLEPVTNACARMANLLTEKSALIALYKLMSDIIESCPNDVRQDLDTANKMRPWRLLLINRGIVATRSQDPAIMKAAFDELLMYLPDEADGFFEQGLKEVADHDYPPHVRRVIEFYHQHKPSVILH